MPGVTISEKARIGARSLVTSNMPSRSLAFGVPARVAKGKGEYPRSLSHEEKETILLGILRDYVEYAQYRGNPAQFEETNDGFYVLVSPSNGPPCTIAYSKIAEVPIAQRLGTVVVSLSPIDTEHRQQLDKNGIPWIDLADETRSSRTNAPMLDGFSRFLFRYGIRLIRV
jgi:hypothetical protein